MKKLASMHKTGVSSEAIELLSKEKIFCLGLAVLMMAMVSEQIRLALLNW